MQEYDIVVIGAGPGGYVAAIRASQLGAKVAVVEKEKPGGTCLNQGCIPTKALVAGVEIIEKLEKAADFGIEIKDYSFDFTKMIKRKDAVVNKLQQGIGFLFKKNKIDLYSGKGKLLTKETVEVETADGKEELKAKNIIIATGSSPLLIPSFNYDGQRVITSTEALELQEVPESLLIVGAGVIGCEFASIFSTLGSKVIMVDVMDRILPTEDRSISLNMTRIFKKKGVEIKTGIKIKEITPGENGITAVLEDGSGLEARKALVSIGRKVETGGLGLEEIGIEKDEKGAVIVNERMETNVKGIYAIGDITNKIQLAHVASAQGIVAAENVMGKDKKMDYRSVPNCIFTSPEIASVGLTAQEAKEAGYEVLEGRFSYRAIGKALAMGEEEGMVKLVVDKKTNRVLGGQLTGAHASDLIAEITLAIKNGLTAHQIASTIHAHPTLAEAVMEAAEAVYGKAIHG